jgi:hypothetical protein
VPITFPEIGTVSNSCILLLSGIDDIDEKTSGQDNIESLGRHSSKCVEDSIVKGTSKRLLSIGGDSVSDNTYITTIRICI